MDWVGEGGDYTPPDIDPGDYCATHPGSCGGNPGGSSGAGQPNILEEELETNNPDDGDVTTTISWDELIEIGPDGWKSSITVTAGWGSHLDANGKKVPTVLYWGLSLVRDNYGGIQLFYETLDIEFNPTLQLNPGEQAQPSELYGIGISATKGPIWRTDGKVFVTNDYEGAAHSSGGGWSIVTADYYESFPNPNIKGLDVGVSAGSPSLWSFSTQAHPLFDMDRIDLSFWDNP